MHRKILQQSISIMKHESVKQKFEVDYFLIESEISDSINTVKENCSKKTYGIEIVKKPEKNLLKENQENDSYESELIFDFSSSKSKTKSVIDKLAQNTVTPISLRYIIEDILAE